MRPVYHMSGFLNPGLPIYEIRNDAGMSDMLIGSAQLGDAVARVLADKPVALLRGHGNVVVAANIRLVVYRAIYTEINARLQMQALSLGGAVNYLEPEEGKKVDEEIITATISRPWELWKRSIRID
jgi:ribulose-5-phosphate 4-epimerase/fuculose-1-phosphate aldolase